MSTNTSPPQPLAAPLSLPSPTLDHSVTPPTSTSAPPKAETSSPTSDPLAVTTEEGQGSVTPSVPLVRRSFLIPFAHIIQADMGMQVHLRVLVISGESHVFTFEPETTVGRMKELIWSMWPSGPFSTFPISNNPSRCD